MYVHALAGGGAERVWAILATEFCKFGHEVVVAVDYEARENMAHLSPDARLVVLGGGHLRSTARLAGLIRRERPDVTISALASSNLKHTVAAVLAGRLRRSVITYHGYTANERGLLSRIGYLATPLLTRMAARTIAVSDGLARYLQERLAANPSRLSRIYNPVLSDRVAEKAPNRTVPVILSVGRLDHAKDHQTLLRAFAKVRQPSARLVILGEGVEYARLEAEIDRLGLSGRVELRGYVMEPWSAFAEASCLVLSSRVEAFGLAMVEAWPKARRSSRRIATGRARSCSTRRLGLSFRSSMPRRWPRLSRSSWKIRATLTDADGGRPTSPRGARPRPTAPCSRQSWSRTVEFAAPCSGDMEPKELRRRRGYHRFLTCYEESTMKFCAIPLVLALSLASGSALAHGEPPQAVHGGLVQEAQELWLELVVKDTDVTVYILDDMRKPVPAAQVSGTATVLVGGKSYKVALSPAGANSVQGKLPIAATGQVVATVSLKVGGKAASARFTNKA